MNNYKTYIYLTLLTLLSCKGNDGNEPQKLTPQIRYEFSGGAGHYNYAPSIIEDQYGIRYGFVCENRDPFKIVDYVYLYKGIPTEKGYGNPAHRSSNLPRQAGITATSATRTYVSLKRLIKEKLTTGL